MEAPTLEERLAAIEYRLRRLEQTAFPQPSTVSRNNAKHRMREINETDAPTEKHRVYAKSLGVDVGPEWGKFKNYCLAHGKRYVNFEAAFRNWISTSTKMNQGGKRVLP